MRIMRVCVFLSCLVATSLAVDEHRPKRKEDRGKRNLEYQVSHHYSSLPSYRLERRISTGSQYQNPSQYFPRPYRKDIHNDDPLTENNQIQENVDRYGYHKPHIVERPVYIKEPEPIIEIIIKESNVSLPAPPPPPPPPKKKKEQVQVFYVKYQKNPHGTGKDSITYDRPVPAISPTLPESEEEQEEVEAPYDYSPESATAPPPPSTTLRTIIKPDSETYHSPSGVKVTFGKEGFDYEKRSSKPEDYQPPESFQNIQHSPPFHSSQPLQSSQPQGRQLTSYSNAYFKRPATNQNYQSPPPGFRQPQPYRPITFPSPTNHKPFGRQTAPQYQQQPQQQSKYSFQSPPFTKPNQQFNSFSPQSPHFSHTISHPPPARFQNPRPTAPQVRQPVPYKPFDNLRPQQTFSQPSPITPPHVQQQVQFRPETHFPVHQQLPLTEQTHTFNQQRYNQPVGQQYNSDFKQPPNQQHPQNFQQQQQTHHQQNFQHQQHQAQPQQHQTQPQNQQALYRNPNQQQPQSISQNEHLNNLPNILPPGGQLIPSVSKYEQHISSIEPEQNFQRYQQQSASHEQPQNFPPRQYQHQSASQDQAGLSQQQYQQKIIEQFNSNGNTREQGSRDVSYDHQNNREQQEELRHYYQQNPDFQQRGSVSSTSGPDEYQATRKASEYSSTPKISYQSTTLRPSTTTEAATPSTTTKDPKVLEAQLPDEVPDELREQLLSSGILNNADISILDYDKVGDIPLSALPPDQLANFYGAGGGAQIAAGSDPVPSVVQRDGNKVEDRLITEPNDELESSASDFQEVNVLPQALAQGPPSAVDLKVVHYDPDTDNGQQVQEKYVPDQATQVNPVVLNDNSYNRYLPLKVNGTQFPIPDVPELKGKRISSVVVLAPVSYDFSSRRKTRQTTRELSTKSSDIELIEGAALKDLLANPTLENYKKFLENEKNTKSDKQSVILLVTDSSNGPDKEREIFMYDVVSQTVTKLSGELSSAFVDAAEANSEDNEATAASNLIERRVSYTGEPVSPGHTDGDLEDSASDINESKIPIIDPLQDEDMDTEASENLERFVDISGRPIEDFAVSNSNLLENHFEMSSTYSKTGHS
ncbi:hypothetical protein JTB14_026178 [Gonioctena quinquepunctata]|nr:hypothetical protein JTB14_026178 [Gonioctena quinquepunctata]